MQAVRRGAGGSARIPVTRGHRSLPGVGGEAPRLRPRREPTVPDGQLIRNSFGELRARYRASMRTYEIHCGDRVVSRVKSYTPRHAVTDYLRSLGCSDDEMEAMSDDVMAWRGAVYTAVETEEPSQPSESAPSDD